MKTKRFVFDINTLVSGFLIGSKINSEAFRKALSVGVVICTKPIKRELTDVFLRQKFDKYISLSERIDILSYLETQLIEWPEPVEDIRICRDSEDDKFLELAVACKASCIVTGDKDLLILNPFRTIPIINSKDFLTHF